MVHLGEALKDLYRSDSVDKNLILDFFHPGETEPFLHLSGTGNVMSETMEIEESLSSDKNIEFGSCEASQFEITLVDVQEELKDSYVKVYQTLEGMCPAEDLYPAEGLYPSGYTMPLGHYVVQSADKQANRKYRDLVALDYMSRFDVDVLGWYNSLTFPMTLRTFRASLCRHVGVTEKVPDYLPNDGMLVEKTIDAAELLGRSVLIACEQANGAFGHFDRNGVLQHVVLQPNDRLVPAPDLYPSEDLFPALPGEMNTQVYDEQLDPFLIISCQFEEYTVKSIDTVQIRQEEGDIGAIYGKGANCYTVEGNFLLYGKGADELADIARNIYGMVSGRSYIPYSSENKGLPYIETGDAVQLGFGEESIVSYVIKRTLKGVYALKDSYSATGDELRRAESNINTEIIKLKGKTAVIKKNVDEVSAKVTDLGKSTEAQFKVTADRIESTVKRLGEAESLITQTAEQIDLKVNKGEVSAQISIESGGVSIKGNRFSWESTNSSMTADGTLTCKNANISGTITAGQGKIAGFEIDGDGLRSTSGTTQIDFGDVVIDKSGMMVENWWFSSNEISCMAGTIATDDGDLIVHGSRYYDGWTVADALDDLRSRVGSGGCGSDCSDNCSGECSCENDCDQTLECDSDGSGTICSKGG